MKAEPLKGKVDVVKSSMYEYDLEKNSSTRIRVGRKAYYEKDVASAVEWLKKQIEKDLLDWDCYSDKESHKLRNLINKAFEDVVKEESNGN